MKRWGYGHGEGSVVYIHSPNSGISPTADWYKLMFYRVVQGPSEHSDVTLTHTLKQHYK